MDLIMTAHAQGKKLGGIMLNCVQIMPINYVYPVGVI